MYTKPIIFPKIILVRRTGFEVIVQRTLLAMSVGIEEAESRIAASVPKKVMEQKHIDSTIFIFSLPSPTTGIKTVQHIVITPRVIRINNILFLTASLNVCFAIANICCIDF
jgi:peroxiredoxin